MSETILVMTVLPDADSATRLTRAVLESRLAACVNRLAPCESEYWWRGEIERSQEWPLLIKTTQDRYAALEAAIRLAHPYEVPEIVAMPVVAGFAPYLAWVAQETRTPEAGDDSA
ncbi:divalent-cation tolerance protein CutA [Cupriavidus basilensis]|uniref:Divalent-cation tolerance protein CutA n=1 Tax=Cupriavidus basilensis TaxID=68895 RepID=A0ABT6B2N9_9BURK|nr:divalent-cation tolerance protein CutA [Cupriavidus basilensis]MDF3839058.1 divalent-cation tolerance protein CutA [Cupriavidus basilensis]